MGLHEKVAHGFQHYFGNTIKLSFYSIFLTLSLKISLLMQCCRKGGRRYRDTEGSCLLISFSKELQRAAGGQGWSRLKSGARSLIQAPHMGPGTGSPSAAFSGPCTVSWIGSGSSGTWACTIWGVHVAGNSSTLSMS